jgi:hypothetical protein
VRWIVASYDISDHIEGSPSAHMALVYDPGDDRIISGHVEASPSGAVASAFERLDNPSGREPDTLACDKRVIQAVRLQCAGFKSTPEVVLARDQDLLACAAIFKNFPDKPNPAAVHEAAIHALDEPARIFLESACWEDRADSEPLLLDAVIDGERVRGLISVMGNGTLGFVAILLPMLPTSGATERHDVTLAPPFPNTTRPSAPLADTR